MCLWSKTCAASRKDFPFQAANWFPKRGLGIEGYCVFTALLTSAMKRVLITGLRPIVSTSELTVKPDDLNGTANAFSVRSGVPTFDIACCTEAEGLKVQEFFVEYEPSSSPGWVLYLHAVQKFMRSSLLYRAHR